MVDRVKILVPGDDPPQIAGSPALERLQPYGDVTLHEGRPASKEEQIDQARDFHVVINSRGSVTWRESELRELASNLRMITTCSIGTDMIDLEVARELGITVSNQPGRTAPVVAEHMFGLLFTVAKRAAFQTAEVRQNRWTRRMNLSVQGKTLGIVGTGNIGAEMARLGRCLGMEVLAWTFNPSLERARDLGVTYVELDELLERSDYVSLHVALSDETRHLISAGQLACMRADAVLLNGARGGVVDLDALATALAAGRLAGAGLDVFPDEPFEENHPIKRCEQVVMTPHAADQTPEGVELLNQGAVDNVIAFLEGRPQNNVAG
ncbi:MAG: 2-hydroxyacid dehydrogenase [Candidatus Latescibacterota bacterium]|nr:2-hydroxyacid dehydrogenase [Candidatus Latescibacterota bacterium]